MNQRQKKKRMTKALKILNQANVVESDYDIENVLWINVEDTQKNIDIVKRTCGLLGINKNKFLAVCREERLIERTLDLASGWFMLMRAEPKHFTIWHSVSKGFYLVRYLEEV